VTENASSAETTDEQLILPVVELCARVK